MKVTFSTGRKPPVQSVLRLYQFAAWASQRETADVRTMIRNTPVFSTAWDGKTMIGMARCGTDFIFRAVLWDVIVDPQYSRQGIGSVLVKNILEHRRLKRIESFWLSTTDKHEFYERFGFKLNAKNIMVWRRERRD